jgi:dolichol kinase
MFLFHLPTNATFIGEALLVTSGLVLYFGDFLACTIAKIFEKLIPVDLVSISYGIKRTETGIIVQGLLLGLLLFPMVFRFVLHIYESSLRKRDARQRNCSDAAKSVLFFVSLLFFMVVAVPSWMQFVHDFNQHPFLWYLISTINYLSFVLSASVAILCTITSTC